MSGGNACQCPERKKPAKDRAWICTDYKVNYSAFNGYKPTSSDYSAFRCNRCGASWRSKMAVQWPISAAGSR